MMGQAITQIFQHIQSLSENTDKETMAEFGVKSAFSENISTQNLHQHYLDHPEDFEAMAGICTNVWVRVQNTLDDQ